MRTRASSFADRMRSHSGAWVFALCAGGTTAGCSCPPDPLCLEEGTYRAYLEARESSSTCVESWTEGWTVEFEVREWEEGGGECGDRCCAPAAMRITGAPEGAVVGGSAGPLLTSGWAESGSTCRLGESSNQVEGIERTACVGVVGFGVRGAVEPNPGSAVLDRVFWTSFAQGSACGESDVCAENFITSIERIGD